MKEIKFRAWDKEKKEMIYQDKKTCFHIADGFVGIDNNDNYREWSWNGGYNCELMQYTGQKDKNKKEIFDGDILGWKDEKLEVVKGHNGFDLASSLFKYPHQTWKEKPTCGTINMTGYTSKSKIIGNIYENPELLDKK